MNKYNDREIMHLSSSCDPKNTVIDENRFLYLAVRSGNINVAKAVIDNCDINKRDDEGYSLLDRARNFAIAKLLVDYDININSCDKYGNTAIFNTHSKRIAELLIQKGCDLEHKNNQNQTALFSACYGGRLEIVRLLVKTCNVNAQDDYGMTPLHVTTNQETVEFLIKNGAKINVQDEYGETPIFRCDYLNKIRFLVESGADTRIKNKEGKTALEVSQWLEDQPETCHYDYDHITAFLKQHEKK